jgi:general transcription factor IIIA
MKRKLEAEDSEVFHPPKSGRVEECHTAYGQSACCLAFLFTFMSTNTCLLVGHQEYDDSAYAEKDSDQSDEDYDHDGRSTANAAPTPMTAMSGISPRNKFPSELKTIQCTWPNCGKTFNRPARLNAHLRSHTNDRPFRCTYPDCDKSYLEEKHLRQHINGSHSKERHFTCAEPDCGKSFLTSTRLRRHQLVHEGQERFRCREYPPCNQSFRKHQTLQRHIRAEHLKVAPFQCTHKDPTSNEVCTSGFETSNSLKRHIEREHGELKFWCEECGGNGGDNDETANRVGFPTLELLQKHMEKAHISCMFCDRTFPARDRLENHIELEHAKSTLSQRKKFACSWDGCSKTFVKQHNLNAHIRSAHEGVRFVCGEFDLSATEDLAKWRHSEGCGDGFTTKGNLENHVRYVHLGLPRPPQPTNAARTTPGDMLSQLSKTGGAVRRTIPCTWFGCSLKFAQQSDVENHLQTHLENPGLSVHEDFESKVLGLNIASSDETRPEYQGLGMNWEYPAADDLQAPDDYPHIPGGEVEYQQMENQIGQLDGLKVLEDFLDPALAQF